MCLERKEQDGDGMRWVGGTVSVQPPECLTGCVNGLDFILSAVGNHQKGCKQGMTESDKGFDKIILAVAWRMGHRPELFWILFALKIIKNHQADFSKKSQNVI